MNKIYVDIDFTNGTLEKTGIDLISGDYASTEIEFTFDESHSTGRKVFEMKSPSGQLVMVEEIVDNKILLTAKDENENNVSLFNESGYYIFEVSYYDNGSKLTSVYGRIPVQQEQVIIGDEIVEPYLPIFDRLMQEIDTKIDELDTAVQGVENLNIEAEKVEHTTTITITRKDGTSYDVEILDGEQGPQGEPGQPGAIKMVIVETLPQTGSSDTLYFVPKEDAETSDIYDEYAWVNNTWERLGEKQIVVDLSDYVKFTDYATDTKGGIIKSRSTHGFNVADGQPYTSTYDYTTYQDKANSIFISKGTLENVITGKGLVSKTDYADNSHYGVVALPISLATNNGYMYPRTYAIEDYNSLSNTAFIGKGTLERVLDARIGDIETILDNINGESVGD